MYITVIVVVVVVWIMSQDRIELKGERHTGYLYSVGYVLNLLNRTGM